MSTKNKRGKIKSHFELPYIPWNKLNFLRLQEKNKNVTKCLFFTIILYYYYYKMLFNIWNWKLFICFFYSYFGEVLCLMIYTRLKKSSCYFQTRKTWGNPWGFSNSSRNSARINSLTHGFPRGIWKSSRISSCFPRPKITRGFARGFFQ